MKKKIIKISISPKGVDMSRYFSKKFFMGYEFEVNNLECRRCDFWIIFGVSPEKNERVIVNPKNVFLITEELEGGYDSTYLSQFEKVFTIDTKIRGNNIVYRQLGYPWFINQTFDNLYSQQKIKKTKLLSIVSSNLSMITYSRNYKIRYDFCQALKKYFGDEVDIYGRGFHDFVNKEDGLLDYKFSVALENMAIPYNFTEKLADCFLTHTFPFYYGATNIERFYDRDAYVKLDIQDHAYSIKLIKDVIETPSYYEEHLGAIVNAKQKYLLNYSFQAVMVDMVENHGVCNDINELVHIKSNNRLKARIKSRIIESTYNLLS